jgi:glutathionylspermidine synthase
MDRIKINPRTGWEEKIRKQGFVFYDGYYNESAAYVFTSAEVDRIEAATNELFDRCLDVVQYVIDKNLWDEFFIPRQFADLIKWSWDNDQPAFYGRFDLAANRDCTDIKLIEFNADTPTSLLEASVVQWYWLQEYDAGKDQFNSLHERLIRHMGICKEYLFGDQKLTFTCARDSKEDFMTVKYLQDCADQAGMANDFLHIDQLGVRDNEPWSPFCRPDGTPIFNVFKLYPYEWMFREQFSAHLVHKKEQTLWIEPPYKALLSNKMLLVYLHKLFPDHPNVLPCFYGDASGLKNKSFVRKPVFGREGSNVSIVQNGQILQQNEGAYGSEGFVYQQYQEIPKWDGNTPVLGSWLIGGESGGMGIKETTGLIHDNMSMFCPHFFGG